MDFKLLSEVDLREALGPINRAVSGHYLPSVRTVSQLRERAQLGVLDLKLSRCAYIGRDLVGACLVERVDESAHLDAIGVDPLAQQRGVGHALLESACVAAEALGVRRFTAEVSEADAPSLATLHSAGFQRHRGLSRYVLRGNPASQTLPEEVQGGTPAQSAPSTLGQAYVQKVELSEALEFLEKDSGPAAQDPPFHRLPVVLGRLKSKLTAFLLLQLEEQRPVLAAAVIERDRHQLLALCGEPERLPGLVGLLLMRHGVTLCDSLPEDDAASDALEKAGMTRVAVRGELLRTFK